MTYSSTSTYTYTVADIKRVLENFAADYDMIAQLTKFHSQDFVTKVIGDVTDLVVEGYLNSVDLVLVNASGATLKLARYEVETSATGWANQRPGGAEWYPVPGGALWIILHYSSKWNNLPESKKDAFRADLQSGWGAASVDTSLSGLQTEGSRTYASNGFGMKRTSYSR